MTHREISVSQTLTVLEIKYVPGQLETAVWEQMMAYHMVHQETVVNALVSRILYDLWINSFTLTC